MLDVNNAQERPIVIFQVKNVLYLDLLKIQALTSKFSWGLCILSAKNSSEE